MTSNAGLIPGDQPASTGPQLLIQSSAHKLLQDEEYRDTPPSVPNGQVVSKAQIHFKELVQDLWGSYFDAVVDADGYLTIGQAVRAVAEFIIDWMAMDTLADTPEDALQSIASPQDIKLMQKALWLAQAAFGDLSRMISGADETALSHSIKVRYHRDTLAYIQLTLKLVGVASNMWTTTTTKDHI